MFPILIAKTQASPERISFLCHALENNGGVLLLSRNSAREFGLGKPEYLLFEAPEPCCVQLKNAIALFWQENRLRLSPGGQVTNVLVECENSTPEPEINSQTLRCGMRKQADICFSSMEETQAMLSVNRKLKQLTGKELLPGEFRLRYQKSAAPDCLLAAGVCLLLTKQWENGLIEF